MRIEAQCDPWGRWKLVDIDQLDDFGFPVIWGTYCPVCNVKVKRVDISAHVQSPKHKKNIEENKKIEERLAAEKKQLRLDISRFRERRGW